MRYTSNIQAVIKSQISKLGNIAEFDPMLRTLAFNQLARMKYRIHIMGIASDGKPIGTYSPEYMKVRTGAFANAGVVSRGKNKGARKNSGTFTQRAAAAKVGTPRPKYNRNNDPKVVASLTRQLENNEAVVSSGNGYAIKVLNPSDFKKVGYLEETYKKKIFKMTAAERAAVKMDAIDYVQNLLRK